MLVNESPDDAYGTVNWAIICLNISVSVVQIRDKLEWNWSQYIHFASMKIHLSSGQWINKLWRCAWIFHHRHFHGECNIRLVAMTASSAQQELDCWEFWYIGKFLWNTFKCQRWRNVGCPWIYYPIAIDFNIFALRTTVTLPCFVWLKIMRHAFDEMKASIFPYPLLQQNTSQHFVLSRDLHLAEQQRQNACKTNTGYQHFVSYMLVVRLNIKY